MTANVPAPIQVVAGYPQGTYGRNLPTGGIPESNDTYRNLLTDINAVLDHQTNIDMTVGTAMLPNGINTCYRQAALMMLFSLKPFQKMLNAICNDPAVFGPNPNVVLINELQRLCSTLWDSSAPISDREKRMRPSMTAFWTEWQKIHPAQYADGAQADACEFLVDLLGAIADPNVNYNSSYVSYLHSPAFKAMFQNSFIRRSAFECKCPSKHRYTYSENREPSEWTTKILISKESPTFAEALANTFYTDMTSITKACVTCNTGGHEHPYKKFKVPPEVIFFEINYIKTLTDASKLDDKARCNLPEVLDLSLMQDSPGMTKRSCKYDLWSVIDYAGKRARGTTCGHYRCHIHKSDDEWQCIDSNLMRSKGSAKPSSLEDIQKHKNFRPRLVAYIRQTDSISDGPTPAGVTVATIPKSALGPPAAPQTVVIAPKVTQPLQNDDSSNWTAKKLTSSLKEQGIAIPAGRQIEGLRAAWKNYQANPNDYGQYTVAHLKSKILDLGLTSDSFKKADLVKALKENDDEPSLSTHGLLSSARSPCTPPASSGVHPPHQTLQNPASSDLNGDRRVSHSTHESLRQTMEQLRQDHAELLKNLRASIRKVETLNVTVIMPTRHGSMANAAEHHFLLLLPLLSYTQNHWIDPNYTITVATGSNGNTLAAPTPANASGDNWKVPITVHIHVPGQSIAATDCEIDPNSMPKAICYNRYLQFNHECDTVSLKYLEDNTTVKITRVDVTNYAYSRTRINIRPTDSSSSDKKQADTFSRTGQKFGEKVHTDLKVAGPINGTPDMRWKRRLSFTEDDIFPDGRNVQPKLYHDQSPGQADPLTAHNSTGTSAVSPTDYSPSPSSPAHTTSLPQTAQPDSAPPAPQSGADSGDAVQSVFDTLAAYFSDDEDDAYVYR